MMLDAALAFMGDRTVYLLEFLDVQLHLPIAIPVFARHGTCYLDQAIRISSWEK